VGTLGGEGGGGGGLDFLVGEKGSRHADERDAERSAKRMSEHAGERRAPKYRSVPGRKSRIICVVVGTRWIHSQGRLGAWREKE